MEQTEFGYPCFEGTVEKVVLESIEAHLVPPVPEKEIKQRLTMRGRLQNYAAFFL